MAADGSLTSTHDVVLDVDHVVKSYRDPRRAEPQREWETLQLLARHAPGLAPTPHGLQGPPWVLTMSRLPGRPQSRGQRLDSTQLDLLGRSFERLWTAVPATSVAALRPRRLGQAEILGVLEAELACIPAPADAVCRRAFSLLSEWLVDDAARDVTRPCAAEVLGRGDSNLDNVLWDGTNVYLVDFEDAGRTCRAYELADQIEHLGSRATPDPDWLAFSSNHIDDCGRVFLAARRAMAAFWLLLLVPGGAGHARNPTGADVTQAARLVALLSDE